MAQEKTKRTRRKKKELDEAIWSTLEKQIIEQGFNDITLNKLSQEAGIELPVFYNRFKNKDDMVEQYVRKYDYWLNDIMQIKEEDAINDKLKGIFVDLINDLYSNEVMQRILVWELNDTHKITRRMAQGREVDSTDLIEHFSSQINNNNFKGISALIIGGIYYLILHRKISTFCNINYNTPQGKKNLIETIESIIDNVFPENTPANKQITNIAKKLLERGVDKTIIKESTGLSIKEIDELII